MIKKKSSRIKEGSNNASNLRKLKSKVWQRKEESFEAEMKEDQAYYEE